MCVSVCVCSFVCVCVCVCVSVCVCVLVCVCVCVCVFMSFCFMISLTAAFVFQESVSLAKELITIGPIKIFIVKSGFARLCHNNGIGMLSADLTRPALMAVQQVTVRPAHIVLHQHAKASVQRCIFGR